MFALYKQRVNARTAYARNLLKQDIFDFSGNDRWYYDREDAAWAADSTALDAIWKQSVRNDWLRLKLAGKKPDEIRKTLDKRYANLANAVAELNGEDAFQSFLTAYTNSIDPHTDYFNPRSAERFNQAMSLSLEGIGAQLQKQDDVVVIREVLPGGPAARSNKLEAGDRIVAVGQGPSGVMEDVVGWRIDDVVEKIKGPQGHPGAARPDPAGSRHGQQAGADRADARQDPPERGRGQGQDDQHPGQRRHARPSASA